MNTNQKGNDNLLFWSPVQTESTRRVQLSKYWLYLSVRNKNESRHFWIQEQPFFFLPVYVHCYEGRQWDQVILLKTSIKNDIEEQTDKRKKRIQDNINSALLLKKNNIDH